MDPHTTPELQYQSRTSVHTPNATLPPVISGTDKRALHRAQAHTNICLICQLPRRSHGHPPGEAVCCCEEQEGGEITDEKVYNNWAGTAQFWTYCATDTSGSAAS